MKSRVAMLAALTSFLLIIPIGASADECPTVNGNAIYNFGNGMGVANLHHDGERVFVPITPVSFTLNFPFVTRVTSWDFPGGTVEMTEEYELMPVGPNFQFDSTVTVTDGGSGDLTWSVNSIPAVGLNTIRHITGSVCVAT